MEAATGREREEHSEAKWDGVAANHLTGWAVFLTCRRQEPESDEIVLSGRNIDLPPRQNCFARLQSSLSFLFLAMLPPGHVLH